MTILDRIDSTLNGDCPCGGTPRPGSPYCSPDCEPTHIARDTDTRQAGRYATPMRWRPDLVNDSNDTHLTRINDSTVPHGYTGRYNASVYRHTNQPGVWHLRLDNGHRYVGLDINEETVYTADNFTALMRDMWQRLEREMGNTRHLEPDDDPWHDVMPYPTRWRHLPGYSPLRRCQHCNQHVATRPGTRMVADRRPAAYLDPAEELHNFTHLEPCDLCANCRKPFPGPPVHISLQRDHWTSDIRVLLAASGYETVGKVLRADGINGDNLASLIQQTIDQLETRLFATPAFQPPPDRPVPQPYLTDLEDAVMRMINAQVWATTFNPHDVLRMTVT